ncbi:hypothetical protein [Microbulbifer spongiae]|uniref:Uncharacterized protein n=1 Tax=Microbulbifer spongiae TaxID=2944933 RepID=A0ABY9EEW9_9GAMM|nr:hypothetical protein [Microbulbifer sp. MI-G]WKD51568.1 hypothetical protein M8T91_09145 [Microbulbifer sp. MI-G]
MNNQYWRELEKDQKVLYLFAIFGLIIGAVSIVIFVVEGGPLTGTVSWRKPILFSISFSMIQINIAWLLSYLPVWRRRSLVTVGFIGWAVTLTLVFVFMQQLRGTMSHFNWLTGAFNAVIARLIILFAVLACIGALVITFQSYKSLSTGIPSALARTVRAGLVFFSIGNLMGFTIIANVVYLLFYLGRTDANLYVAGEAGRILLPHVIALYGLSFLSVAYWVISRLHTGENCFNLITYWVYFYSGCIAWSILQAYPGEHTSNFQMLSYTTLTLLVIALVYGAYRTLHRTSNQKRVIQAVSSN